MRTHEIVSEIERLSPSSFQGGKDYLDTYGREKSVRELPGGSGLLYSITNDGDGDYVIKLWDKDNKGEYQGTPKPEQMSFHSNSEQRQRIQRWQQGNDRRKAEFDRAPGKLVGKLTVNGLRGNFPLKGAVQVGTITVDEDYRGAGLAKALYGIVLTIMKRPLVAGSSQTPGGRRNWMSLSQIPGVETKGYMRIDDYDLETRDTSSYNARDRRWGDSQNKQAEKSIDTIMGKLGGEYIGKVNGEHYFAFDVKPNTTKQELQAYVDTNLTKVYGRGYNSGSGLYAVWTGQ